MRGRVRRAGNWPIVDGGVGGLQRQCVTDGNVVVLLAVDQQYRHMRAIERVLRVDAQSGGAPIPLARMPTAAIAEAKYDAPPIAAGRIEIRWEVTLTATLK